MKTKPAASAPAKAAKAPAPRVAARLAPADEYFGPLKMSILGIRNEIRDLGLRYFYDHDIGEKIVGMAEMTEQAVLDWQTRYPDDTMLARHVYLLEHLYAQIDEPDARAKADLTAKWLLKRYSKTWYAKNLRISLARDAATRKAMASATPEPSQADHETTAGGASVATPVPVLNLLPSPSAGSGLSAPSTDASPPAATSPSKPSPSTSPAPAAANPAPGSGVAPSGASASPAPSTSGDASSEATAAASPTPSPTASPARKHR